MLVCAGITCEHLPIRNQNLGRELSDTKSYYPNGLEAESYLLKATSTLALPVAKSVLINTLELLIRRSY